MIYFTSDTHFWHKNILKYGRDFKTVEDMNNTLIQNWNVRVKNNDEVWFLGDFAFRNEYDTLQQLNGKKHLIVGNHDRKTKLIAGWESVDYYKEISVDGRRIVLFHYPIASWNCAHHGALHFHGHCHGNFKSLDTRIDVGVDCWEYKPVTLNEILDKAQHFDKWHPIDHHKKEDLS